MPGSWSEWQNLKCSAFCGLGVSQRTRECAGEVPAAEFLCQGSATDAVECTGIRNCIRGNNLCLAMWMLENWLFSQFLEVIDDHAILDYDEYFYEDYDVLESSHSVTRTHYPIGVKLVQLLCRHWASVLNVMTSMHLSCGSLFWFLWEDICVVLCESLINSVHKFISLLFKYLQEFLVSKQVNTYFEDSFIFA